MPVGSLARLSLRAVVVAAILGALAVVSSHVLADNTDPHAENVFLTGGQTGSRYAWSENAGWLKARGSAEAYGPGGSGLQVTDTDLLGYLWGESIGWVNMSCLNDATCGTNNWGVKNDGLGHLSGYAWAENAGWINFSCTTNGTCANVNYGVTIDPATGQFHGNAWAENLGWVSFNCADRASCGTAQYAVQTGWPDSDGDGCRDSDENGSVYASGGDRSMWNVWDFYDVPFPALRDGYTGQKPDHGIGLPSDVLAVLRYAGVSSSDAAYTADADGNGIPDGVQYDRSSVSIAGHPLHSGPPDGGIGLGVDVLAVLAQAGSSCS